MSLSLGLRRFAVVVFYAALAIPLFMIGQRAYQALSLQARSESFPTARGVVTHIHAQQVGSGKHAHTVLYFEARYVVRGQTFTTDRIDFRAHRSRWLFEGSPDWIVASYPVGSEVRIAFDPERPEVAALWPGFVAAELGGHAMLFPFYLLAIGVLALPWFLLRRPQTPAPEDAEDPLSQAKRQWPQAAFGGAIIGMCPTCVIGAFAPPAGGPMSFWCAVFMWAMQIGTVVFFATGGVLHFRGPR